MKQTLVLACDLFTWRSALDILLISAALFFLYRTMLRLGTWKIMAGIFLALAVFIMASLLDLKGIEWIYQNVSHVAVFALVVIFQPELRKILERAVSVSSRRLGRDTGIRRLAPMLAECLGKLAGMHCGAILVFPGNEPIQNRISGGYQLNAVPSKPLILSIFDDNSPGHDGAVIIEGDRITRFGVRLPLSATTRLSEEYGTRHHAAMGLAEQTDALILVVSEERGLISLFSGGEMRVMRNIKDIIREITDHQEAAGFFLHENRRRFNRKNLAQITACLLLSSVFWFFLATSRLEVVERIMPVSIDYTSPSEDLILMGEKINEVQVHLTGPKSDIDNLSFSPPTLKIDLSKMAAGTQTFAISDEDLQLPKGVRLLDASPPHLQLTLAPMVEKKIVIRPQLIGALPGTLKLRRITVSPDRVLVAIPATRQEEEAVSEVLTTPLYLESISSSQRLFCEVVARPTIQPLGGRWPDVEVFIEVAEEGAEN